MGKLGPGVSVLATLLSIGLPGCNQPADPASLVETLEGTYTGDFVGISTTTLLSVELTLEIRQAGSELWGSYTLAGTLSNRTRPSDVRDEGSFTGGILTGRDPELYFTLVGACSGARALYAGTFDSDDKLIIIRGPVDIRNDACGIVASYQATILLHRPQDESQPSSRASR